MFTTNSLACYRHLASRSRAIDVKLKIPCSITYVRIYTRPVRSRVTNLQGAPGDQNRDIHLMFLGLRLQRGYRRYVTITKPHSALLCSTTNSRVIYFASSFWCWETHDNTASRIPYLNWQKLKVNIFPHDGEMEKVEGDGVRGGLSPLTLASKPYLLPQQRKVGLMRRQTQHHLPREHNTVANAATYTLHP